MKTLHTELEKFFSQFKVRKYKKHDHILHEDDTPNGSYFIKSGYIRLYSISPEGQELTRLVLGPYDLFPLRWTLGDEAIDFYVEAMTDVTTWFAPRDTFLTYLKSQPDLFLEFLTVIVHRMEALYKRMEFFAFGNAYQKVASILLFLAKRFGEKGKDILTIDMPLTQEHIASLAGVSRETVNIELDKLRQKGLITINHRYITINDGNKLRTESSFIGTSG